jgi:hypothetical protein
MRKARTLQARQAGKLPYIGFTAHKDPHIHLHTLAIARAKGFTLATVQMPLNVMDAHYRSFEKLVLPEPVRQHIGVLGMKAMGNGIILRSGTVTALECLQYALRLPTSVVVTGIDRPELIEQAFEALGTSHILTDDDIARLLARTAASAAHGAVESFKTTSLFDPTATNPAWLGEEPERLQQLIST